MKFILNFYAPSWFHIISHPTCQDGAKNFFFTLTLYQKLDKTDQSVIHSVLQNNSYFCHPENILLAVIGDEDENIRKFACEKMVARKTTTHFGDRFRCFDKNSIKINFTDESYINMVDLENVDFDSPPLLQDIMSETIANNEQVILSHYPCHSQDVGRNIKDISAVCGKVYGCDSRHGALIQIKKSRLDLPMFSGN